MPGLAAQSSRPTRVDQPVTIVQSETRRFADLLSSGLFAVPWHQRYYDWKPRNVEELLLDVQEAVASERAAYFVGADNRDRCDNSYVRAARTKLDIEARRGVHIHVL